MFVFLHEGSCYHWQDLSRFKCKYVFVTMWRKALRGLCVWVSRVLVPSQPACPQVLGCFKDSCIALHVQILPIQSLLIYRIFAYLKVLITFNQIVHVIWQFMAV